MRNRRRPNYLDISWHEVMPITGVALLSTDGCHRDGGGGSDVALQGDSDVAKQGRLHLGRQRERDVTPLALAGGWSWGDETTGYQRFQGSLNLPVDEGSRLGLQ